VLSTHFDLPHRPSERQIQLVELYARLVADALETANLYARAEQARDDAERALAAVQEADRRKDEFLAMLAHELRNPLAPIRLILHSARLNGGHAALTPKQLATLDRQSAALARLVDDLLDVARVTQGKIELRKEPLSISAVILRAIDATQQIMEERAHRVTPHLPETGSMLVNGDPVRLEQVLVNILGNAAKYTPRGGRIEVSALERDGRVEIRITDNGEGLEARELECIFELFTQVGQTPDRAKGGLGLGLKIVRSLVEMHGGRVRAESPGRGQGSTFVIELPAIPAAPASEAPGAPPALERHGHGMRVLIVDDNPDVAEALRDFIDELGHSTQLAHDGREALAAARAFEPDLVLLDIGLPGLDGYEVARKLRDEGITDAPLVAITGYGQRADQIRAQRAGFSHHLVKPVQIELLCSIISEIEAQAHSGTGAPRGGSPRPS
jgi:signal transduction histidine kinase/ActR/RegA family two-component response regulator